MVGIKVLSLYLLNGVFIYKVTNSGINKRLKKDFTIPDKAGEFITGKTGNRAYFMFCLTLWPLLLLRKSLIPFALKKLLKHSTQARNLLSSLEIKKPCAPEEEEDRLRN